MCVQDGDWLAFLDLGTRHDARRQGHGASALATALKWARNHGALTAWLQVELDSDPALALYRDFVSRKSTGTFNRSAGQK